MRSNVNVHWNSRIVTSAAQAAAKSALQDAAEFILQESNAIAPLDEGTLTRSGDTDVEVGGGKAQASVYYDTPYATELHEHPEYSFQNGREGKYLEKVLERTGPEVRQYLVAAYRRALS